MNALDMLELPDGAVEMTASVADDSLKAGETGVPVSIDNEAEPVPLLAYGTSVMLSGA